MLDNALQQTGWSGVTVTEQNWRALLRERLAAADWDRVISDVEPFLAPGTELALLAREHILQVIG